MCGIFAAVNGSCVTDRLLNGLQALSYRGYDSAGIAMPSAQGLQRRRSPGKLENLALTLKNDPLSGPIGIGHTRWATHGAATATNAHPHMTPRVAVVHNGIVENHSALREELQSKGFVFESETDSEVIPALIDAMLEQGYSPTQALRKALQKMEGAIAVAVVFERFPSTLFAARINSPLVIGSSGEGHYLSSDANAFSTDITRVYHLSDGEIARLTNDHVVMEDPTGTPKKPAWSTRRSYELTSSKGCYEHYMLKEIHEQPKVLNRIIDHYMDPQKNCFSIPYLPFDAAKLQRLTILACGSSYFAGMMGKAWLEKYAGLAVDLDIASEYVHRNTPQNPDEPVILISQSGETADTLAALRYAKRNGRPVVSVVNVPDSTMALESDLALPTLAGPEVGVASTKAFTAQMAVLAVFATHLASQRTQIEPVEGSLIVADLQQTCSDVERILTMTQSVEAAASLFQDKQTALFIGRGPAYALAEEGALKLKEISYIHAEAYPAGELKHGPIALIDSEMPVVAIAPPGDLFAKTMSNLREVASRGARVILISDREGIREAADFIEFGIALPPVSEMLGPLVYTIPLQYLAYQVALSRGTDIDQPRNLAKSVTVE